MLDVSRLGVHVSVGLSQVTAAEGCSWREAHFAELSVRAGVVPVRPAYTFRIHTHTLRWYSGELGSFKFNFLLFTTALSQWDFSNGKFGLPFPGKASCDRVALPDLGCILGVLVFL